MAILNSNKGSVHGLANIRDTIEARLQPTSADHAFVQVSTEGYHSHVAHPDNATLASDLDRIADSLHMDLSPSFENFFLAANEAVAKAHGQVAQHTNNIPGFGKTADLRDNSVYDAAIKAAAVIAQASRSPKSANAYRNAALATGVDGGQGIQVIGASNNPAFGFHDTVDPTVSTEAFDNRNLEDLRAFSTLFAFSAAIQDEFSEAFFPTLTLSPDSTGLEVSQRRTMVHQEIRHELTGEPVKWVRRNLLDALTDHTILINEATRIYPQVLVGNAESEKHFVDKAVIAPKEILGPGGAKIFVAPLKAGAKIDLLGAGANERTNGTPDQTDAIDQRLTVEAVYLAIKTSSGESVVRFDTRSFAQHGFYRSFENQDRRVILDFPTTNLVVTGNTLDYNTKDKADALKFLGTAPFENVSIALSADFSGNAHLQFGNCTVNGNNVEFHKARTVNGPNDYENITDETTISALAAQFEKLEFLGYEVKAYYPNTNKRFLGILCDSLEERVRYAIPLSPPVSVQTPITGTATATDLAGPMNAQRIMNSLNAVTKILDNVDVLRNVAPTIAYGNETDEAPAIEGFARVMVRPCLFDDRINIADVLSSTSTAQRFADVQAALVNKLRYAVAHVYTESRLQPAIDALNGTAGERPEVVVGTDPKTASYLMVNGDPRLLGLGFETKVVVSYDYRMRGKIYASFVRKRTGDVDLLTHGVFAYIPELATQAMIPFNGATTNVTQVQNRNLHIIFLPVAVYIEVDGLEQAASQQVGFPMTMV